MFPLTAGIFGPQQGSLPGAVPHAGDCAIGSNCSIRRDPAFRVLANGSVAYFAWCNCMPQLQVPGLSEMVLQPQAPPQLQK